MRGELFTSNMCKTILLREFMAESTLTWVPVPAKHVRHPIPSKVENNLEIKSIDLAGVDDLDPADPFSVIKQLEAVGSSFGKLRIAVYIILGAYILSYTRENDLKKSEFKDKFCIEGGPSERTVDRYMRFARSLLPVVSKRIGEVGDRRIKVKLDPAKTSPKVILENLTPARLSKISLTLDFNSILEAEASIQGIRTPKIPSGEDESERFGDARKEFVRVHSDLSDLSAVPDNVCQDDLKLLREIRVLVDKILKANNA